LLKLKRSLNRKRANLMIKQKKSLKESKHQMATFLKSSLQTWTFLNQSKEPSKK